VLGAGEQITVSPVVLSQPKRANLETATAWTKGELVFDSTPVSEVIEEFNRYSKRRLVVEDARILSFHISGVFASSEPSRVAELLHQRFGVAVHESDDEIRIAGN
jgi:transmembrane sensor